jgi:hypothetical protein
LLSFGLGTLTGFLIAAAVPVFRVLMMGMWWVRVLEPAKSASLIGGYAVVALIFTNNAIPVLLSFVYPMLLARIPWAPPLTKTRNAALLTWYTLLTAYLVGFFDVGGTLGSLLFDRGATFVGSILRHAWLHGPIELAVILLCVAEPARIAQRERSSSETSMFTRHDVFLLVGSLVGLFVSAVLEFGFSI